MHVSSQESAITHQWARRLYQAMVGLILLGIVMEGLLIGPSLFAATHWGRAAHVDLGGVLFLLMLLLPLAARLAHLPGKVIGLSAVLFALALLEVISPHLGRTIPFLAAVHPANALLMMALTVVLLVQERQRM